MLNEIAVVKSLAGEGAKAINSQGEQRELHVGDAVYDGEKIVTHGAGSKVTVATPGGKEITLIGEDSLSLNKSILDAENSDETTISSIDDLQKAILSGQDLNALEETAAGGNAGGNAGGDRGGVSLGAASFVEGGHYSNITSDFRDLSNTSRSIQAPENSISGYADNDADISALGVIVTPDASSVPPVVTPPVQPERFQFKTYGGLSLDSPVLGEGVRDARHIMDEIDYMITVVDAKPFDRELKLGFENITTTSSDYVIDTSNLVLKDQNGKVVANNGEVSFDQATNIIKIKAGYSGVIEFDGLVKAVNDTAIESNESFNITTEYISGTTSSVGLKIATPVTIIDNDTKATTPVITNIIDNTDKTYVSIANGGLTNDKSPILVGQTSAFTSVNVYDNGKYLGHSMSDKDGRFVIGIPEPSNTVDVDGVHKFTVTASKIGSNYITPVSNEYSINIDSKTEVSVDKITVGDSIITGTGEVGADIKVTNGTFGNPGFETKTVVVGSDGKWSASFDSPINSSNDKITVEATDIAGNKANAYASAEFVHNEHTNLKLASGNPVTFDNLTGRVTAEGLMGGDTITLKDINDIVSKYDNAEPIGLDNPNADIKMIDLTRPDIDAKLIVTAKDIFQTVDKEITVKGDGDSVKLDGGWRPNSNGGYENSYDGHTVTIKIEGDVTVDM